MGTRAERRERRKLKVNEYAQRLADAVKAQLEDEEVSKTLEETREKSKDAWDLEFSKIVASCTERIVKTCPQEKQLVLDGMRHYLDVLLDTAAEETAEVA